jgi:hypothetical protein
VFLEHGDEAVDRLGRRRDVRAGVVLDRHCGKLVVGSLPVPGGGFGVGGAFGVGGGAGGTSTRTVSSPGDPLISVSVPLVVVMIVK